jgi:hypothetical protein
MIREERGAFGGVLYPKKFCICTLKISTAETVKKNYESNLGSFLGKRVAVRFFQVIWTCYNGLGSRDLVFHEVGIERHPH